MLHLPYNTNLKDFSRKLRNHSTPGEIFLWQQLKARSMMGYQFNRQKPLECYIVDFYCRALNLVIEVDGGYHNLPEVVVKDKLRQSILETMGLNFLRFTEQEVCTDIRHVLLVIEHYIVNYEERFPEVKACSVRRQSS